MPSAPPSMLPVVVLRNQVVSPDVLQFIPLEMVRKYQITAYGETNDVVKLAIVHPEQLKQGFMTALQDLGKKIGKKIELAKTDAASFQAVLAQYEKSQPKTAAIVPTPPTQLNSEGLKPLPPHIPVPHPPSGASPKRIPSKPPLFEIGKSVAFNYLKRVPIEYAKANRVVCVDFLPPNIYWFVSDGTREELLSKLIPQIERQNKILVERLTITAGELDDLLDYYEQAIVKNQKEQEEQEKEERVAAIQEKKDEMNSADQRFSQENAPEVQKPEAVPADVTVPDDHATVVTSSTEKEGLAGFFQRVNMSLNGSPKDEEEKIVSSVPVPPPSAMITPETGVSSRSAALPVAITKAGPNQPPASPAQTNQATPVPQPPATPAPTTAKTDEESSDIGKLLEKQVESLDELKEIIKKGFIPRIVAAVISFAIHEKSSDVHIEAFQDEVRIRYRIDGQLLDIVKLPVDVHAAVVSRIKILSRLRLDETRVPQDGRFDVNFGDVQVDLRVSLMPTVHGEKVVMRILDKSRGISSLEKLGIEGLGYQNLTKSIEKPFGICLSTGPTGSGKSTSLYAILNRIATPNVNVVTLEDPVEYEMKGINQAQIRPKIGFTFAEGLRSILRQDPNIIMVGEIRDGETANMATQAALTGHLVLSTLHTNDAAGAIPRLSNMGIEPFLIASSLNVAMGQRLVRKICPDCKKEVSLPPGFKNQIETDLKTIQNLNAIDAARITWPLHFYQGMGCSTCGGKGYQGRVGIYEVLVMTEAVEELTLSHASNEQIQQRAQKEGMLTMYQDGLIKVINGITTLDEVLRETANR